MAPKIVTEAGYYAGKFLKPGQSYEEDEVVHEEVDLDNLSDDEKAVFAGDKSGNRKAAVRST
ncbi:hypothetical protein PVA19_15370 [Agrobacterium sp. CNPSo 3708]|uniref:hypothetical protein n=1 Tax=Agrobacterium sp. CNPSo 3708 TaxID=3028150 RepID=UPI00236451CD|nr:hypothetical protein [Agrobacterium sp. CNPSo 3708]MDD1499801.1 hypothetical protein [Agrobacterium sp. CNPSo 3708]